MSTRPLGPQSVVPDDPGPWSGVLEVLQRRGGVPGRRRAEPPNGLMIAPPPGTALASSGLDDNADVAGAGRVRVIAAARQPAIQLDASDEGVTGISRLITRVFSIPDLAILKEDRPETDPAAAVEPPVPFDSLAEGDIPPIGRTSSDGRYAVVPVIEQPRSHGLVVLRVEDRAVMRYIRFARCGVWAQDGTLVIGGDWGLLAMVSAPPPED